VHYSLHRTVSILQGLCCCILKRCPSHHCLTLITLTISESLY
jgi:hypothetical protein